MQLNFKADLVVFSACNRRGRITAVALRQAMLATLAEHPNPRDWAAFFLIGL